MCRVLLGNGVTLPDYFWFPTVLKWRMRCVLMPSGVFYTGSRCRLECGLVRFSGILTLRMSDANCYTLVEAVDLTDVGA